MLNKLNIRSTLKIEYDFQPKTIQLRKEKIQIFQLGNFNTLLYLYTRFLVSRRLIQSKYGHDNRALLNYMYNRQMDTLTFSMGRMEKSLNRYHCVQVTFSFRWWQVSPTLMHATRFPAVFSSLMLYTTARTSQYFIVGGGSLGTACCNREFEFE